MYVPEFNCFMRLLLKYTPEGYEPPGIPVRYRDRLGISRKVGESQVSLPGRDLGWWISPDAGSEPVELRRSVMGWYLDVGYTDDDVDELVNLGV